MIKKCLVDLKHGTKTLRFAARRPRQTTVGAGQVTIFIFSNERTERWLT